MQLRQQRQLFRLCELKTVLPLYKYLKMPHLVLYTSSVTSIHVLPSQWQRAVV